MRRSINVIALGLFFVSLLFLGLAFQGRQAGGKQSIVPSVQAKDKDDDKGGCPGNCSLHTLNGCYGFSFSGNIVGFDPIAGPIASPIAGIGVENFDGQGHITITQTLNINGSGGIPSTVTGTYTVNPDCTGSTVITQTDGSLTHIAFVIVDNGKELLTLPTDPGSVITGTAKRQ